MSGTKLKVHIQERPEPEALKVLRSRLDESVGLTFGPDVPEPAEYSVLVAGRPTERELTASPALTALVIPWAGLPQSTRAALVDRPDIHVYNIHHNAAAVAEMAMALMLAVAKSVVPVDRAMRRDDWSPRYSGDTAVLLEGRNALVLGYGAIGRRIAAACRGLGMSVAALRRHPGSGDSSDRVLPPEALRDELPHADVLHVALPHTDLTHGVLGKRELALLPAHAILVNVARGAVVDEEALFSVLSERRIRGAGLDVWYSYPESEEDSASTAPSRFPFRNLDNVVMSPHRAGAFASADVEHARVREIARALNAAARGNPLPHPVDVRQGY